ncbi:glycosyltransferase family 2 protein [Vibrio sp. 10N.261.55.A7]|uniref:glycosyltransferase family 2 protein n=1 Tax=Vibrio sp. 10N.261.55.A7 TaxID=1880851 RepID=UPI000C83439B|nr:glycosyltransferase family 2 protein [Vibrio sp. 10N.261.55.A7]PMJ99273.1 bactoprenol glucosyl transferase [Vibrio sp. 10N.261.55.A7]
MTRQTVSIVCPVYNEQDNIPSFVQIVSSVFEPLDQDFEILFIDDGSSDLTLESVKKEIASCNAVRFVSLTRNFGKDAALTAGLNHATGDAVIPMDVDLQDPPQLIPEMIALWQLGNDVVLARRKSRHQDSWLKRNSANLYYYLMSKVAEQHLHSNVGDFRLLSRNVVDSINKLEERSRYMQGILSWVGYKSAFVEFDRQERVSGSTKFNFKKLLHHALDGLTSFSTVPLRFWSLLGIFFSTISFSYGIYIILYTLITGGDTDGFASIFTAIVFFGGIQLIGIGVLGEYIGRIYIESKARPLYLIKEQSECSNTSTKK